MIRNSINYQLPKLSTSFYLTQLSTIRNLATATTVPSANSKSSQSPPKKIDHNKDDKLPVSNLDMKSSNINQKRKNFLDIKTIVYDNAAIEVRDDDKFLTKPAYPHVGFTEAGVYRVKVTHRIPRTLGDKISYHGTMFCRNCFDFITGYKALQPGENKDKYKGTRYEMTEGKWLTRVIFLESIAGVPGAVASFLRTLNSLRLLKRDKAWIQTLIDEAYNERMHLLTFIKIGQPSWFTRTIMYIGQGIFANAFFLCYLANPTYCHRFVGYLEEEAVRTYTHLIDELNDPEKLKGFQSMLIPTIAVQYWPSLSEESSFKDLILRIRADESKHREINHTLANLNQRQDRNPFALQIKGLDKPQPNYGLDVVRPTGWERKDLDL
ncbi:AOX [Candida pseudojiufengensis]|uniref:AOX n=1 Tax=Candida pseudojiufengensis TaxID=497109 RepID=UPI002225AE15|nr:AOX [Candida pseudojiufengensis]KAI5961432.1 AOX [Candida pseudojiufengensis]